jgi:tetratricopeptide (TPR) repeat protein
MIRALILFMLLLPFPPAAALAGEEPESSVPLSRQLEGLDPGPRIAYLRHLAASRPDDPEVFFQLGVAFHESGEEDSALHYYERSLDLDPSLSKVYVNMGVLWDGRRRPEKALGMFEKAVEINPGDLLAHTHAALVLVERKRYEEAWTHLERALAIDPRDPQPRFVLAICFWECGMLREAIAEWETVIELAPGTALAAQAETNIGLLQRALTESLSGGQPPPAEGR